jgi:hypothetical protein
MTLLAVSLVALVLSAPPDEVIVYTHATVETVGKAGRIDDATLVVHGGKVEAIGTDVKVPEGAQVIDGRGKTIMPGIVDPFRAITIAGVTPETDTPPVIVRGGRGGQRGARGGGAPGGFTRLADNFYPYEAGYRTLLRSGLTEVNLVTNGYGQSAIMRVTPAQPERMLVNPDGFLFTTVSNDTGSLDLIRTALDTVDRAKRGLPAAPQAVTPAVPAADAPPAGGRRGGRRGGGGAVQGRGPGPGGFDRSTLKLWQDIYEGKAPLFANAANPAAIIHLLKLLEPYSNVRLVLAASGPALVETIDHLAGRKVCVLLQPGLSLKPNTRDRINVAQLLHEAGVSFAFTQPPNQRDVLATQDSPLFPVAYLIRCGLPRKAALEALTARPAEVLGLGKTQGSVEPGKSADLLIFSGDPFDPDSQLSQVLVEGRTVYEN